MCLFLCCSQIHKSLSIIVSFFFLPQAQRCVTELKSQVNRLQAEVEEQRTHKQMAMVENEHLRMEVEALRSTNVANIGAQIGFKEADGESSDVSMQLN